MTENNREFYLSRISSKFSRGKYNIVMWGYDESGNPAKRYDTVEDYYYVKSSNADLISMYDSQEFAIESKEYSTFDNDKAVKVISKSYLDKNKIIKNYAQFTYEADTPIEFKYICNNDIKWSKNRRIGFFDIEVFPLPDENGKTVFPSPDNPYSPITSIQIATPYNNKITVFTWHPNYTLDIDGFEIRKKNNVEYFFCDNEKTVLYTFFEWLKKTHIDIITGWYSNGFDTPYILRRCEMLGIDQRLISPAGYAKTYKKGDKWRVYITGLDNIDMLEALQDLGYNLSNYKLATAAKEILDDPDMEKLTHVTWRDWKDNFAGFLEYSIRDVEVLVEIEKKLEIFSLYITLQELANLPLLNQVLMKSTLVDFFILTEYGGKLVFPTRNTKKRRKYMGGMVLDPREPGLHRNIGVLDFASLYPTTVMAFNLSPETFITSENDINSCSNISIEEFEQKLNEHNISVVDTGHSDELFNKRYWFMSHKQKVGILPKLLKKLYLERKRIKKEIRNPNISKEHANALDKHQKAIKLVLNSTYGAMGFPWFRLYTPEVADAITYFARKALQYAIDSLDNDCLTVIYGDTDSAFFKEGNYTYDEIVKWVNNFNNNIDSFICTYNGGLNQDYNLMEIEFEKDMDRFYMSDSKKRYYGIIRGTGKKYIRGLNIIRKDAPVLLKSRLNELAEKCVYETITAQDLINLREEIESAPIEDLGITKAFGKRFEDYVKNVPQHLKGAMFANTHFDAGITHMDTPLMYYIVSHCEEHLKKNQRTQVICVKDDQLSLLNSNKDIFEIDWNTFFKKQVLDQLDEFNLIEAVKTAIEEYKSVYECVSV